MPCHNCKIIFKTGLSCTVCKDFSLCTQCYEKDGHSHAMKKLIVILPPGSFPKNQLHACALELREHPIRRFIQDLARAYHSVPWTTGTASACGFLFAHFAKTNLVACSCVFCKRLLLMYKSHSARCQIPKCSLRDCPIINVKLLRKRFTTTKIEAMEQRLLRIRLAVKNVPGSQNVTAGSPSRSLALSRKFTIQRCVRTLVHACRCVEADCMPASCQRMKRILAHVKSCKQRIVGGCNICKQLCTLCCYHARNCHESKCPVLLCSYIKRKLRQASATIQKRFLV